MRSPDAAHLRFDNEALPWKAIALHRAQYRDDPTFPRPRVSHYKLPPVMKNVLLFTVLIQ